MKTSKKVLVLAFLQNMWVKDPERVKRAIARDGESFRQFFIEFALFRGCKTGRMIKKAFPEDLLEQFTWEETTREIAGDPKTIFPADAIHIQAALKLHTPVVVLTFGKIAHEAVKPHWDGAYVTAHHPAARHPDTFGTLQRAATQVKDLLGRRCIKDECIYPGHCNCEGCIMDRRMS